MGKKWDSSGIAFNATLWSEMYRVLTPGAYLMAFGGTRTFHRMACAIEDAGFEIRDCLMWLYSTGFPKSHACLKPAYEPIILARKPGKTVLPLNIDECRVGDSGGTRHDPDTPHLDSQNKIYRPGLNYAKFGDTGEGLGRWPANTILNEGFEGEPWSRYFYCAKASRKERDAGLDAFEPKARKTMSSGIGGQPDQERANNRNIHPTVKPLSLTEHLAKLILPSASTESPRRLLVPFSGSGSEMIGGLRAGWDEVTGVELSEEYAAIAEARISFSLTQ
jgi:site-specific DNA-methyltransferase (adenine-specific)